MKKQAGFTLIELIMVIVILGVLAAFALPRFADLGGEARAATIQGIAGSLRSAASIAHAKALAENDDDDQVVLEGLTIALVNGYPQALAANNAGILGAAQVSGGDITIDTSGAAATNAGVIVISANGAPGNCQVSYNAADANQTPVIDVDTGGCGN